MCTLDMYEGGNKMNNDDRLSIKVSPVLVTDMKGLDKAVSNGEKVIIINNKDLFSAIKKNVDKDANFSKKSGNALKISAGLIGAGAICGIFTPLLIPGVLAMTAGIYGTAGSGVAKAISSIKGKLRKYRWVENDDKNLLFLLKAEGENKFDSTKEEVDVKNTRKCEG